MDRDEFRGAVRRWFEVEAYDDGQLDELAERVEEQLDELGYSVGELFDADARDVAEGLAWFEERERAIIAGERSDELGELDLALMLLTAIGMEPPAPAARANRPAWLCGEWELAASPGAKRAATRRWCFEPDGSCATSPSGASRPTSLGSCTIREDRRSGSSRATSWIYRTFWPSVSRARTESSCSTAPVRMTTFRTNARLLRPDGRMLPRAFARSSGARA